jgi:hypothetical protein
MPVRSHIEVAMHVLEVVCLRTSELIEDRVGHRRRELLRAEPVAAPDNGPRQPSLLVQSGDDVLVQWLADGRRVLGPVEYCHSAGRERQLRCQMTA